MTHIVVDGVSKRFGRFVAVQNLNLDVEPGEFVGLFGPNGAGKTTLMRMVAALSAPSEGRILLDGEEMTADRPDLRRKLGVLTHDTMLYDGLSARENLHLHAKLHGVENATERCEEVLDTVGLTRRASERPSGFSHGLRKRLALARAILHDPPVLLLDEPYTGLDRRAAARLESILDTFDDRTVLMTTHDLERGYNHCSRAVFLANGAVQMDVDTASVADAATFVDQYESAVEVREA